MHFVLIALISFSSFALGHDYGSKGRPPTPGQHGNSQWQRDRDWDRRDRDAKDRVGEFKIEKGTSDFTSLQSYIAALMAIQLWNQMVRVALLNPLDDYRRENVHQAKVRVESAMANLEAEVGRGTLTEEQLDQAKQKLSTEVDESAADVVVPKIDYANEESRGVDAPRVTDVDESKTVTQPQRAEITIQISTVGKTGPVAVAPQTSARELASAVQAQQRQVQAERSLPQADRLLSTGGGYSVPQGAVSLPSFGDGGVPALPAPVARVSGPRRVPYGAPSAGSATRPVGVERVSPQLAAIERAIASWPADEPLGEILTENMDQSFHAMPDMMGGRILAGNFGPGIAGVRIEKENGRFVVRRLTQGQLAMEYARLGLCWLAIFAPLIYGAYRFGLVLRRRRETKRLPPGPRVIEAEIIS